MAVGVCVPQFKNMFYVIPNFIINYFVYISSIINQPVQYCNISSSFCGTNCTEIVWTYLRKRHKTT